MKRIILIFIGLFCFNFQNFAQLDYYSKKELNQDIDSLYAIIGEIHPDMFANIPKSEFEGNYYNAKSYIKDSMNRIEFYKVIAPLVVSIGDGHTSLNYPSEDLKSLGVNLFPFVVSIDWRDTVAFTQEDRNYSKSNIPIGSRIVSINNRPIADILGEMYRYVSGEKVFFKAASLPNTFTALLFIIYNETAFDVKYEFNGLTQTEFLKGVPYDQRYKTTPSQQTPSSNRFCTISVLPDSSIAIIKINYFLDDGNWATFMDSSFTLINTLKIKDLIIDIRNNGGGFSVLGDSLFQYISPADFLQFGKVIIKTSRRQIDFQESAYNMKQQYPIGITTVGVDPELEKLIENPLRFYGNKYLLINNYTYSSAASFSWAFQYFKMGKVVGEESGGMAVCFGEVIQQSLPNTNLQLNISHNKYYQYGATDQDTHGTIPDYIVPDDKALDYTIELIMKERN